MRIVASRMHSQTSWKSPETLRNRTQHCSVSHQTHHNGGDQKVSVHTTRKCASTSECLAMPYSKSSGSHTLPATMISQYGFVLNCPLVGGGVSTSIKRKYRCLLATFEENTPPRSCPCWCGCQWYLARNTPLRRECQTPRRAGWRNPT